MDLIKIKGAEIHRYRCISSDQKITFDGDITGIIGENEAGKTSILEALAKANYFDTEIGSLKYDAREDYPKRLMRELRDSAQPAVTIKYEISDELAEMIFDETGERVDNRSFDITTDYDNKRHIKIEVSDDVLDNYIMPNVPVFLYYDEYYALPSRFSIDRIMKGDNLTLPERTARALLFLADIDPDRLGEIKDYSLYRTALENIQADFTEEFLKYWSGNKDLQIEFEFPEAEAEHSEKKSFLDRLRRRPSKENERILEIRINDRKNMISMPLEERSRGFNWFFSFWVWFKAVQKEDAANYVFLLDEPGMWLHEEAQKDLLRLMKDISENNKIIFTTHSPYMAKGVGKELFEIKDGQIKRV